MKLSHADMRWNELMDEYFFCRSVRVATEVAPKGSEWIPEVCWRDPFTGGYPATACEGMETRGSEKTKSLHAHME